jgi:dipeptidyl aminopeptidase/acylaminoacyl peptidase
MAELLHALLETRSAMLVDVSTDIDGRDRLLIRSDLTGTMQLYELGNNDTLRPVTDLPEPVGSAAYVRGGGFAVVEVDTGGDERYQLNLVGLKGEPAGRGDLTALTNDPRFGHLLAGVSPDGTLVAYLSNRATGVDFDLWVCDVTSGEHRRLYAGGAWCQPASGFSPDGRWVSVLQPGPRPLDTELLLVEVATAKVQPILAHPDEAAEVGPPVWWDATSVFVSSNVGCDRAVVVRVDLTTGQSTQQITDGDWDAAPVAAVPGIVLAVVENRNGASRLSLVDPGSQSEPVEVPLIEPGVVSSYAIPAPRLSPDGSRLYYTLSTPQRAGDVWSFERSSGETRRLTTSPTSAEPERLVSASVAEVESFDGELVPLHLYRPTNESASPSVVIVIHGGPESQATMSFNPIVQALAAAGYAVVVPNVRGSTGYGKRYASLDDTTRRLDSVRDLAAIHGWLASAGLDSKRAALWGGSYGGYMVLAGLAFQPALWAAGVDIVGISDLVTFLENTSEYRRAHREREYGSLATDREFLASASPLRHADDMRAPLFMIHGRNDPRVPVGETEQLAIRLQERGVDCQLVVYDNEGHGLARLPNRLDAYPKALAFLERVLAL